MKGMVTVTDVEGGLILEGNIWLLDLGLAFSGKCYLDPRCIRIYIDGVEVLKPEPLTWNKGKGGEVDDT